MLACSPHVLSLRERISIDAEPISTADFDDLVKQQEQTLLRCRDQEASALSHFEVMTALAYKHFQQHQARTLSLLSVLKCARDWPMLQNHLAG